MKSDCAIIILTYNSEAYIPACLERCFAQTRPAAEIVVVDNGSTDPTPNLIQTIAQDRPEVQFYPLDQNIGFAAGMNYGIRRSTRPFILCLNADLYLDSDYLETMMPLWEDYPGVGSLIGRIRRMDQPNRLDSVGNYLSWRFTLKNSSNTTRPELVFAANGCAPFYRRQMLESIRIDDQYFDERYYAFMEDTDLAWRSQLAGWHSLYWPGSGGDHKRSGTFQGQAPFFAKPQSVQYLVMINRYRTLIKNIGPFYLGLLSPILLPIELLIWLVLILHSQLNPAALIEIITRIGQERDYLRHWSSKIKSGKKRSRLFFIRYIRF
ncbi:MAG: glycosyltransferase family 2 protein [Candidatus Delongbacteria bacterium]|nr:glycosyltransferase family 2 protein [Candidatus Delongbacteria bacterium]